VGGKGRRIKRLTGYSVRRVRHAAMPCEGMMIRLLGPVLEKRYVEEFDVSQAVVRTQGSIVGRFIW